MENTLPVGLLGLGYAGILAAIMSTVDSMIIVSSASVLKDFHMSRNPKAPEANNIKYARLLTVLFGFLGLATAYVWPDITSLVLLAVFIIICMVPSLLAGMFWKRTTEKAAFFSILLGFLVLLAFLPVNPKIAWAPSLIVSALTILVVSKLTKHSKSETVL